MTTHFTSPPPHYNMNDNHNDTFSHSMHASTSTVNLDAVQPAQVPHRTALTPYLTLPHLLSLTWLAYPVISLFFVAFRLIDSTSSAKNGVADAKANLLSSCLAAQRAASSAASMPRYLAIGSNEAIQATVNASMEAARLTMILSLTIVEAIIEFVVDIYKSTFLCFLELIVRGSLGILIGTVKTFSDFVTSALSGIRTNIQNDVATANKIIQAAVAAINKVTSLVNVNLNIPQFTIPSLDALSNVTLPTGFEDALIKLNNSLPTLDTLRDELDSIIEKPFDIVKVDINDTFASISFNASTFALPAPRTLTFCDQMDTSFVDDLGRDLVKIARVGAGLIVAAAILIIFGNMVLQWWRWRSLQNHLEYIREAWNADPTISRSPKVAELQGATVPTLSMTNHNLLVFINTSEHPLISRILDQFSARFKLTPAQHTKARFFISYTTFHPALVCLLIGLVGLLSVQVQLAAIRPLQAHYAAKASAGVSSFNAQIATQISSGMLDDSAAYAAQVNVHITGVQNNLNNGVFSWVNQTTTSLNNTVVGFYASVQKIVNSTFGGTVLESPAQEFVRCMIGTKVASIENALTFLHDNFKVNLPTMDPNALVLSNTTISEVTQPIAAAAIGAPSNGTSTPGQPHSDGLVAKLVARYVAALHRERIMFAIFLGIWLFVALCAICIILWHSYGVHKVQEWKRKRYNRKMGFAEDTRSAHSGRVTNTATPWSPPKRHAAPVVDGPFPQRHYDDVHLAPPTVQPDRRSDGILARDAAIAHAYLSSTAHLGGSRISQYEDRRYLGPSEDYDQGEKTPLPENLRTFTPLQTPKPSATTFPTSDTAVASTSKPYSTTNSFANLPKRSWDSFTDPQGAARDAEKGLDRKKSRGLSWGVINGKLRNDSRRVTAREPWDFDNNILVSRFEHSPAAETSSNGWFARAVGALWGGNKMSRHEASVIEPYHVEETTEKPTERRLNSDEGHKDLNARQLHHQSIFATPPPQHPASMFTLGAPPPPRARLAAAPAAVPVPAPVETPLSVSSRRADFPQSVQNIDGEFGFASAPRSAAPIAVDMSLSPPTEHERSTQYYAERSNNPLPIHHQFLSPEIANPAESESNPFQDDERGLTQGHRPRPSRSTFPPPGLATSRTLTPHSPGAETTKRRSHYRSNSSVGQGQIENPFVGSPSPFDDPVSHFVPRTPSAFSFMSGRSGAPRAL